MENFIKETLVNLFRLAIGVMVGCLVAGTADVTGLSPLTPTALSISIIVSINLTIIFVLGRSALVIYSLGVLLVLSVLNHIITVGISVNPYLLIVIGVMTLMLTLLISFRIQKRG